MPGSILSYEHELTFLSCVTDKSGHLRTEWRIHIGPWLRRKEGRKERRMDGCEGNKGNKGRVDEVQEHQARYITKVCTKKNS